MYRASHFDMHQTTDGNFDLDQIGLPREKRGRRQPEDEPGPAPCPWCGYSLVARVDRRGPYFYCLCVKERE